MLIVKGDSVSLFPHAVVNEWLYLSLESVHVHWLLDILLKIQCFIHVLVIKDAFPVYIIIIALYGESPY